LEQRGRSRASRDYLVQRAREVGTAIRARAVLLVSLFGARDRR
jgi:hypothetical protein